MTFVGVGLHVPVVTWTDLPSTGGPLTAGCTVDSSSGFAGATGPIRLEYADAVPVVSVALTVRPTVLPTSLPTSA